MNLADSSGSASAGAVILTLILVAVGVAFYITPGIVASVRHVPNAGSVWVLNILLGWTLVGWAIALAMASRSRYQAVMTPYGVQQQMPPPPPPAGFQPPQPSQPPQPQPQAGLEKPKGYQ